MKEALIYKIFALNLQANLTTNIQDYGLVRLRVEKNGQTIPYTINELGIERPVILDDSFEASVFAVVGDIVETKNENDGFGSNYLVRQDIPFELYFFMPNIKSEYTPSGIETAVKTIIQEGIGSTNTKTLKLRSFVIDQVTSSVDKQTIFNDLFEGAKNQLKTENIFVRLTFSVDITFMSNCRNECYDVALQTLVLNCEKPTVAGGGGAWGEITGNLSDQTDLQAALNGKQPLSAVLTNTTASFTTAQETKLAGIEAGAEVNNISDANATDLTDGGDTTLHTHDSRYYTEAEVDGLIASRQPLSTVLTNTTASFTTAQETKLAGIEAGADVTDATNVAAAGAVMESDYTPAHSLLVQQSGTGSPSSLSVPNNTLIGRLSGGGSNIGALTATQVKVLLALAIADVSGLQTALDGKADLPTRSTALVIEAEFYSVTSPFSQGLTGTATSSGAIQARQSEPSHPGVVALRDSTTANGGYRVQTDILALRLAGGERSIITFQVRSVRAGMTCYLGFFDTTSISVPVDAVCLIITANGTTATIIGRGRANNTAVDTSSSFAPTLNTWYTAVITINADATQGDFEIFNDAGVSQWTGSTTNIPTAVGRETGWGAAAYESSTDAAADLIYLDYMRLEINRTLTR